MCKSDGLEHRPGKRDGSTETLRMGSEFLTLLVIGFFAQIVDGALGMAFGTISTTALLTFGWGPAQASALVHTAEIFTTGASASAHVWHRNVDWKLARRLALAGSLGAVVGAYLLSNIDGRVMRPLVAAYLLVLGIAILRRALRALPTADAPPQYAAPLGLVGGFLDAIGGGGWGPTVTTTLLGSGHAPRMVIGSVNTAEFFVTAAAASTFFVELGLVSLEALLGLALGGMIAAPFGAYVTRHVPARMLMTLAGLLVVSLAGWQIVRSLNV